MSSSAKVDGNEGSSESAQALRRICDLATALGFAGDLVRTFLQMEKQMKMKQRKQKHQLEQAAGVAQPDSQADPAVVKPETLEEPPGMLLCTCRPGVQILHVTGNVGIETPSSVVKTAEGRSFAETEVPEQQNTRKRKGHKTAATNASPEAISLQGLGTAGQSAAW